jgi:hypothetical protein
MQMRAPRWLQRETEHNCIARRRPRARKQARWRALLPCCVLFATWRGGTMARWHEGRSWLSRRSFEMPSLHRPNSESHCMKQSFECCVLDGRVFALTSSSMA